MRLVLRETAYALVHEGDGAELAVLQGGADKVLAPDRPAGEAALEAAIETVEDWLMPHAARVRGEVLEVDDVTGRLEAGLASVLSVPACEWSVEEVEGLFSRLVGMATGRVPSPALQGRQRFVADVLVVRELAHHAQAAGVRLVRR